MTKLIAGSLAFIALAGLFSWSYLLKSQPSYSSLGIVRMPLYTYGPNCSIKLPNEAVVTVNGDLKVTKLTYTPSEAGCEAPR